MNPSKIHRYTQHFLLCLSVVFLGCNKEESRNASAHSPALSNDGFQISLRDLPDLLGKPYPYYAPTSANQYEVIDCHDGWAKYTPAPIKIQPPLEHTNLGNFTLYTFNEHVEVIHFGPHSPLSFEFQNNNNFLDKILKRKSYELLQLTSRFSECKSSSSSRAESYIECENYSATILPVEIVINKCGEHKSFDDWKNCFRASLKAPSNHLVASPICAGCYGYQLIYYRNEKTLESFINMIYTQQMHKESATQGTEMPPNEPYDTCGEHLYL